VTADVEAAKAVLAVLNRLAAAADIGEMLYRFGTEWESGEQLGSAAAAAEAHPSGKFPRGVSVWNRSTRPDKVGAARDAVEHFFPVRNTGRDGHRTIVLPNPVTAADEIIFNTLFGRRPPIR
jgi:hypothetical protein